MDLEATVVNCMRQTRRFWDETAGKAPLQRLKQYISELLPVELELACARGSLPTLESLPGGNCDILVLLVGHSFEPLLQATCAYQPRLEIVPVLNKEYGPKLSGNVMRRRLQKLLPELVGRGLVPHPISLRPGDRCPLLPEDSPSAVFRFLLEQLKQDWGKGYSIIVDITGAKKSMVSGAFFFAAYSNTPISYVDFDLYEPDYGRPYGCTCNIGLIDNPYHDFYLRDWARVRRLYEQYAFAAASEALTEMIGEMERSGFFGRQGDEEGDGESDELKASRLLYSAVQVYEAWDNGDYPAAREAAREIVAALSAEFREAYQNQGIPWAVQVLGNAFWPHAQADAEANQAARTMLDLHFQLKYGQDGPEDSLFAQPKLLLAYIEDELAKIKRLWAKKEDYRAAYLRAAGLDEFLLRARLALCWLNEGFAYRGQPVTRARLGADWHKWFEVLAEHSGAEDMRKVLLGQHRSFHLRNRGELFDPVLAANVPRLERYWQGKSLDWDSERHEGRSVLTRLRDEAVHTHLYLSREIAEAAVVLVDASVEEFRKNWLRRYHPAVFAGSKYMATSVPKWEQLCTWCGIDFLPPYREEDEEEESK